MKAAIVLTGMVREYEKCYPNFRSFFDYQDFDYDVFISSWNLRGTLKKGKPDNSEWFDNQFLTVNEKKTILDTYKPVYADFEDYYKWQDGMMEEMNNFIKNHNLKKAPQPIYNGIFSQYYKTCQGIKLACEHDNYDFIIRWRTDVSVNKIKLNIDDSLLFNKMWKGEGYKDGKLIKAIEDFYIAGNHFNMLAYSGFYNWIKNTNKDKMNNYLVDCHWINNDRQVKRFVVELLLTEYLKEKKIKLKECNIGLKIIR